MLKFFLKKFSIIIPTFIGITILSFGLIRLIPGDPVTVLLGERGGSPEVVQELRKNLGLDLPLYRQYFRFVGNVFQGDLGISSISKRPVWQEFWDRFPATIELGMIALFWSILIGLPLGIIAALKKNSFFDYFIMGTSLLGYSMPIFWWGLILIIFFSINLGLTPVSGRMSFLFDIEPITGFMLIDSWMGEDGGLEAFLSALKHLILPAVVLGTIPMATISRMTRSSMLEVLGEDYIRTAKARGLSPFKTIGVHALRNALIPVITVIGVMFGTILTGAILTESIFSWPGIGKWMVHSVSNRDYPVIQAGILLIACMVMLVNLTVDLIYLVINPKIRGQE